MAEYKNGCSHVLKQMLFWRCSLHTLEGIWELRRTTAVMTPMFRQCSWLFGCLKKIYHNIILQTSAYICVCIRAGGGWGPPCGNPASVVGSQLSSSDLILVGLIIYFVLTGAVLDVEWTSCSSVSLNVQTVPHLSESDLYLELCSSYHSGINSGQ